MNKKIQINKADAYYLTSDVNVSYVTNFSGDSSSVLALKDKIFFFTDARYTLQAEKELKDINIVTLKPGNENSEISEILKEANIKTLGIEKGFVTLSRFEEFKKQFTIQEYVDISDELSKIRSRKTEDELKKIRIAANGNDTVLENLIKSIRIGMTELEIKAELLYQINLLGMDSAFTPIVAGGKNSATPHATASDYKIKSGDMLTLDFGCKYEGYCSDITRTVGIGNIDEQLKKIYHIVREAQKNALEYSCFHKEASKIDSIARDYIKKAGYGDYFTHGTGHGVGRIIHESPVLKANSSDTIESDMVFTIEPGIYIPYVGGVRIEDMCIGQQGSLYNFDKDLILI